MSRGVLDVHPGLLIPAIVVLSQFGVHLAAGRRAGGRDRPRPRPLRRRPARRSAGPAGVLPGERAPEHGARGEPRRRASRPSTARPSPPADHRAAPIASPVAAAMARPAAAIPRGAPPAVSDDPAAGRPGRAERRRRPAPGRTSRSPRPRRRRSTPPTPSSSRDEYGPRPGPRAHPPPAADQPGLDPGRDRPRRVGPVPAAGRRAAGRDHRGRGRRRRRRDRCRGCSSASRPAPSAWSSKGGPPRRPSSTDGHPPGQPGPRPDPPRHDARDRLRRPGHRGPLRRTASASPSTSLLTLGSPTRSSSPTRSRPATSTSSSRPACQDAVRTLVRGIEALAALDLGADEADCAARRRSTPSSTPYGVDVRGVAFTRVTLPAALTASLEARRLARPAGRAGGELRARPAPAHRPGRLIAQEAGVAAHGRGARGAGRGAPPRRSSRSGWRPTRTRPATTSRRAAQGRPAAGRQQPGRRLARRQRPHVRAPDRAAGGRASAAAAPAAATPAHGRRAAPDDAEAPDGAARRRAPPAARAPSGGGPRADGPPSRRPPRAPALCSPGHAARIDLRSDTVTHPTDAMRRAMAAAERRRRRVRRRPHGQRARGPRRRAPGQGGRPVRRERHDGQPRLADGAPAARLRGHRRRVDPHRAGRGGRPRRRRRRDDPRPAASAPDGTMDPAAIVERVPRPDGPPRADHRPRRPREHARPLRRPPAAARLRASGRGASPTSAACPLHVDGARFFNAAVALGVTPGRARGARRHASRSACPRASSAPIGSVVVGTGAVHRPRPPRPQAPRAAACARSGVLAAAGLVALRRRRRTGMIDAPRRGPRQRPPPRRGPRRARRHPLARAASPSRATGRSTRAAP